MYNSLIIYFSIIIALVFAINIHSFSGSHDLTLKVKGTGIIATLVRSILGGLNIRKRIKNIWSNEGIPFIQL
jgi:hypothetical protein